MVHEVEHFYGVYLLYSRNPKYKGHTYIGFTNNPNRRIGQHNKGCHAGGARKTSGRGPWDMILIIHGFPNRISALRFEWAWQNPDKSRRLKHCPKKKKNENAYTYRFRIVCHMLRTPPWVRLPLIIRWLKQEYRQEFDPLLQPPIHMPVVYGPVNPAKIETKYTGEENNDNSVCCVCKDTFKIGNDNLRCLSVDCKMICHTLCLARLFLRHNKDDIIPIDGQCPVCDINLLWGDLIRLKIGCNFYSN